MECEHNGTIEPEMRKTSRESVLKRIIVSADWGEFGGGEYRMKIRDSRRTMGSGDGASGSAKPRTRTTESTCASTRRSRRAKSAARVEIDAPTSSCPLPRTRSTQCTRENEKHREGTALGRELI